MTILKEKRIAIHNSALRLANIYYLRHGWIPPFVTEIVKASATAAARRKFNPYHDELGRFTFGPGGGHLEEAPKTPRQYGVTVNSLTQIVIHHPDGTDEIRSGGDKNWRNNNPGNILYTTSDFARRHGAIGADASGFAVFPDASTGYDADAALLRGPSYSSLTINRAIAVRSPPNENDTATLQREITREAGLSGMRIVGSLNDVEFFRLLGAIHQHEGHEEGTVVMTTPQ
jgi:hypothetical protein